MKIYRDGKAITPAALVTFEGINGLYRKKGGELLYIEGSRTYDTLRYGKNDSKLPFEFTFTDRYNYKWKVVVDKKDDTINMFIPCGTQMVWRRRESNQNWVRCLNTVGVGSVQLAR